MRVGDQLVAVENFGFMAAGENVRLPRKLIVEARIVWLTSDSMHLRLPEVDILFNAERVRLPATTLKLPRQPAPPRHGGTWRQRNGDAEWPCRPFYRPFRGRCYTDKKADYYPWEAWSKFEEHLVGARLQRPMDPERRRLAQQLGVDADADREAVNAAFRLRIKSVHPDVGGNPEAFQSLVQLRNALLSYLRTG